MIIFRPPTKSEYFFRSRAIILQPPRFRGIRRRRLRRKIGSPASPKVLPSGKMRADLLLPSHTRIFVPPAPNAVPDNVKTMRYFLELRYNGAAYCGWQRQPDMPTVQQTLERALTTLLREKIEITGAGRTDTGVNASYYVAHFDTTIPVADPAHTVYKLNFLLPGDIAVSTLTPVADDAHARFDARERAYIYYLEPRKNPFTRDSSWQYYVPLDVERMNRAAAVLLEESDFTSFAKLNSNNKTNICRVMQAAWTEDERGVLRFTIRADRFLRNMVRAIVGTLVDVGRGRYTPEEFRAIVRARDLSRSSSGAPAQGLFLCDVRYPAEVFERRTAY